jgi:hypothetical protein
MITGAPGVGKTDCVADAARDVGARLIVCHPVVNDPTDFRGFPWIAMLGVGPKAEFVPYGMLEELLTDTGDQIIVVFFDDLGQAMQSVQGALAHLVLERNINGRRISDNVVFVAATNRRKDKAGVQGIVSMLTDRFQVVLANDFDIDDWVLWGMEHNMPSVLMAFAKRQPQLMGEFEADRDIVKTSTPRSVAALGRLMNRNNTDMECWEGTVGPKFGTMFKAWYETWHLLPDIDLVLRDPENAPLPPAQRPDAYFAAMGALNFRANPENYSNILTYVGRFPTPEIGIWGVRALERMGRKWLLSHPAFVKWVIDHPEVYGFDTATR